MSFRRVFTVIRSGFESKRRESPRIHNVFAQQYGFANFGRVFTVIHGETLSWGVSSVSAETPFETPSSDRLLDNCHSYTRLATEWLHETVTTRHNESTSSLVGAGSSRIARVLF